jgi:glucose 1-dehydrogenase
MTLRNKVAIVTGGAQGIGFAVARRFAADGARVVVADIDEDAGSHAVEELGELGAARFVRCDVGEGEDVANLVESVVASWGSVDVLVNSAHIAHAADFLEIAEADFDRLLRVNLKGAFLVGQAVARKMLEEVRAGGAPGAIVNVSASEEGVPVANRVPGSVSKGGISQLTKAMALALAPYGIRVNAIVAGSITAEMPAAANADPAARRRPPSRRPIGRLGGPAEMAAIAAFLASDGASRLTGQILCAGSGPPPRDR